MTINCHLIENVHRLRETGAVLRRRHSASADGEQKMKVINRRGSYQQPLAACQKKAEGKKRKSPCTPYREKAKGKEIRRDSLGESQDRAHAHTHARRRHCTCTYAEAGEAAAEIVDNCFGTFAGDFRLWAWYCRHFDRRRIVDQAYYYASCRRCGEVRNAVNSFQSWLRKEFGAKGGAA